jgi:hypothetical protein
LRGGREQTEDVPISLVYVIYGDVTNDGSEEALVVHAMSIRGSGIPYLAYVYTWKRGSPQLLWSFWAGDRGDGGLRQVYAEDGKLVVDLYGKNRVVNRESTNMEDQIGVCCPQFFTRTRYEWDGSRFRRKGEEVLPNPVGSAPLIKPEESGKSYRAT